MKTFKQFWNESRRMTKEIERMGKLVKDPNANLHDKLRAVEVMKRIDQNYGLGSLTVPGA